MGGQGVGVVAKCEMGSGLGGQHGIKINFVVIFIGSLYMYHLLSKYTQFPTYFLIKEMLRTLK